MYNSRSRQDFIGIACLTLALMALCALMPGIVESAGTKSDRSEAGQIDINRASAEQLTVIPGIGKVMAERIVQFREQHGPFKRVEDLLKIKGIGEKSFQKILPYVKVGKSK